MAGGRRLAADRPLAAVGELVGAEPAGRHGLKALGAGADLAVREPVRPRRAQVGLGGGVRVGRLAADVCPAAQPGAARLGEQAPNRSLCLRVGALAEVHEPDPALGIDQVVRRPVLVVVGGPGGGVVVLGDRIGEAVVADRPLDVGGLLLERELGRVDPHHGEPVPVVLAIPGLEVGQRPDAVDAGVGPEVDQHHLPAQARQAERPVAGRVEPLLRAGEIGGPEQNGQPLPRGRLRGAALVRNRAAPRRSASPSETLGLCSIRLAGSTSAEGRWRAIAFSNLTSRLAIITNATATITTPIAAWMRPRKASRRSVRRRPPRISA